MTREIDEAAGIETQQSCCGTETPEQEATCCGTDATAQREPARGETAASEAADIETQQGCCSDETSESGSGCGDGPDADETSCCGEQDAGDAAGQSVGRKSPTEHERIREAAEQTERLLAEMADTWAPDWTETDVFRYLHDRMDETGYGPAWTEQYCPAVHAGVDADVGHTQPEDRTLQAGELLHVDFGVSHRGYAADLQRVYYYPTELEASVPVDLQSAFEDVRAAIDAGLDALEPGVRGHEVDAAARTELTDRGWTAFGHAFGHQVGYNAHDGGTLLGPLWDRYGHRPRGEIAVGEVYSVELGVGTTYGYVGQEEMVRVVEGGYEFVVTPQTDIRILEAR